MELSIWEKYKKKEINEKIKYWLDIWEDLITNFSSNSFGLILINPQLIISDIIDEVEFNQIKDRKIKEYFLYQISEIIKNDETIKKYFITEFKLIIKYLSNENSFLIRQVCKKIFEIFKNGKYFDKTYQILKKILMNSKWENGEEEKIRYFSQVIIIEFLLKGYSSDTIKYFPNNIFDKYTIDNLDNNIQIIHTKFPHGIEYKDYKNEEGFNDDKSYNTAVASLIDSLTIENRLDAILDYFKVEPKNRFFIFQLEGLKSTFKDLELGDVTIYDPRIHSMIKSGYEKNQDCFNRDISKQYLNACVKIKSLDDEKSKDLAVELIEKVFDVLRLYRPKYKSDFKVISASYIILDENYSDVGMQQGRNKENPELEYYFFLDLHDEIKLRKESDVHKYFNKYCTIVHKAYEDLNSIEKKIMYSMHWYRKGNESNINEDKLLNYWIAFENIFSKDFEYEEIDNKIKLFSIIKENFPPIGILESILNILEETYLYIKELYFAHRKLLIIPEKVVEASKIDPPTGSTINLKDFLDNIPSLIDVINYKVIKEKLIFIKKLYSDNNFLKKYIKQNEKNIKNDLLLIYRLRNKIVHKAHYDNRILPYYVKKIEKYSRILLIEVNEKYIKNQKLNLKEIILSSHIKIEMLENKIKNNLHIDLFNELINSY